MDRPRHEEAIPDEEIVGDDEGQVENSPAEDDESGDAGQDAPEGEAGEVDDEGSDDELLDAAPKKEHRLTRIMRETKQRAKEAKEKADALERELLRYRFQEEERQRQQSTVSEAEYLKTLTPEQRIEFQVQRARQENEQLRVQMQFQQSIERDRLDYMTKAATDPKRREFAPMIESMFAKQFEGPPRHIDRDTIYAYYRGMQVIEQEQKAAKKVLASSSVKRETVKATNVRSNVRAAPKFKQLSLAEREELYDSYKF